MISIQKNITEDSKDLSLDDKLRQKNLPCENCPNIFVDTVDIDVHKKAVHQLKKKNDRNE